MKIHFYSPVFFEQWDWRNSVEKGIGGSETSQVEMAWRLARRGHEVICYGPIPDDCPGEWRGTRWLPIEAANFEDDGVWVMYRCPEVLDRFTPTPQRRAWLLWQDWDYPTLTPARSAKVERHVTLCQWHARYMQARYPYMAGQVWITSNALKGDLIAQVESGPQPLRDPHRVLFASSPDRGLRRAIDLVERARLWVPDLELHATYGFDNLDKLTKDHPDSAMAKDAAALKTHVASRPWVHFHGRVSQPLLYTLWQTAGLWVYCTDFHETSCITSMEAQALGAIPIVSPVAALAENVRHGLVVEGPAGDPLTQARFVAEIVRASDPAFQAQVRPPMMADARDRFDWERMIDQWDAALLDAPQPREFPIQVIDWPRPQAPQALQAGPRISVLTASIRPDRLVAVAESLQNQGLRDFEWLVCGPWVEAVDRVATSRGLAVTWLPEPAAAPDDIYQLNKAWNALAAAARGDLLVIWCDSTSAGPTTLARLWQLHQQHPQQVVSGLGQQTRDGAPCWVDPRVSLANSVVTPDQMEFRLAAVPAALWHAVGGADESYDQVAGWSEKDLCRRLVRAGGRCYLDGLTVYTFEQHAPHADHWEQAAANGAQRYYLDGLPAALPEAEEVPVG